MILQTLDIFNVRNIVKANLSPSPSINFVYGNNASGKSSLLEAIYILGRAKSFRANSNAKIINYNSDELIVAGQSGDLHCIANNVGIRLSKQKSEIRVNQQTQLSRSALAYAFPLQLIHPKSYKLIDAGAQFRREFIDWGVFNQHQEFLNYWRKYKKALTQRNALLKQKHSHQMAAWDTEIVHYGNMVNQFRSDYLVKLAPVFNEIAGLFFDIQKLELLFDTGFLPDMDFAKIIKNDFKKDIRYGFTHSGPHRGDFKLLINSRIAKDHVSRGQLKILVIALNLAQIKLLNQQNSITACILIDDIASELDVLNKTKMLRLFSELKAQIFITATNVADFGTLDFISDAKMFHVEHGQINEIVADK